MSRNLRWGKAERYFVQRAGQVRLHFRGFALTTTLGRCCRCGRRPDGSHRLYIVIDRQRNEVLEYGIDCWPKHMMPRLWDAIQHETDQQRRQLLEANYALFDMRDLSAPYWEPTDSGSGARLSDEEVNRLSADPAYSIEHNPPEVHLRVSPDEALRKLRAIPHKKCVSAIKNNWDLDPHCNVLPASVAWLYCWGKTGMGAPRAAQAARMVFNDIFDVTFDEYNELVDHEAARNDRYRKKTNPPVSVRDPQKPTDLQLAIEAIRRLSPEQLAEFRVWLAEFDAETWDRQFEEDVTTGRLDRLAEEALLDLQEGRCNDL